jgi:flagellar secretion chaperone FliS
MSDEIMNVRQHYLEQMVESASQEKLLYLLVDGAVNFINRAIIAMEKEKLDDVNLFLLKAQNIYLELTLSLDLEAGEFAKNLGMIYQFLYNLLIEANLDKNMEKLRNCLRLAEEIRGLWKDAIEKTKSEENPGPELAKTLPVKVDPQAVIKTGVYNASCGACVIELAPLPDDSLSRINITG